MIDINNEQNTIVNFITEAFNKFNMEIGEPKSIGILCKPSEGKFSISFNSRNEIDKSNIESIEFEYKDFAFLNLENWRIECQKEISQWKYFVEGGVFESSGTLKIYNINRYLTYILSTIIRKLTIDINLPTTLLGFEFSELNTIILHSNLEKFGRTITRIFRSDNYESYLTERNYHRSQGVEELRNKLSPHLDSATKNLMLQKSTFYNSLTIEQIQVLDKLVLGILDNTAFNVMRALDENNINESGISLTIDNVYVRELPLIGNGNLSGEYFDWVERFSKYGEFQQ